MERTQPGNDAITYEYAESLKDKLNAESVGPGQERAFDWQRVTNPDTDQPIVVRMAVERHGSGRRLYLEELTDSGIKTHGYLVVAEGRAFMQLPVAGEPDGVTEFVNLLKPTESQKQSLMHYRKLTEAYIMALDQSG